MCTPLNGSSSGPGRNRSFVPPIWGVLVTRVTTVEYSPPMRVVQAAEGTAVTSSVTTSHVGVAVNDPEGGETSVNPQIGLNQPTDVDVPNTTATASDTDINSEDGVNGLVPPSHEEAGYASPSGSVDDEADAPPGTPNGATGASKFAQAAVGGVGDPVSAEAATRAEQEGEPIVRTEEETAAGLDAPTPSGEQ